MRFRKHITICKGVRLNLSGSGVTASVGVKGASVTLGKNGIYANYGVPGTGLYNRQKISGTPNNKIGHSNQYHSQTTYQISLDLDKKGNPELVITDEYGHIVNDPTIINKVKRGEQYKAGVLQLSAERKQEIDRANESFINIYTQTIKPLLNKHNVEIKLNALRLQKYNRSQYSIDAPSLEQVRQQLVEESKQHISSLLFWTNKAKREQYVNEKIDKQYELAVDKWNCEKQKFNEQEDRKEIDQNQEYLDAYQARKSELEGFLYGDTEFVNTAIENTLANMTTPISFSVDYEYDYENCKLFIDLDLPEIEDMPIDKANILASGKVSIKEKSAKEISRDYATCVCGLGFYFAGLFFNISINIKNIQISGYTQRINLETGKQQDDYVYAVDFEREAFAQIDYRNIDPVIAIQQFPHTIKVSKTFDLKTIDPNTLIEST